jgi:O-antigen ligase
MTLGSFLDSNKARACVSLSVMVSITTLTYLLPENIFFNYFKALFVVSFLAVLLTFDSKSWFPFSLTHTEIANMFGISLAIASYRLALNGSFIPNTPMMVLLLTWWGFTVIYTVFAYGKTLAYNGLLERQMGLSFRLTIPIFLFASWQLVANLGMEALLATILIGGVCESVLIIGQLEFPNIWGVQIKLSNRFVGSISNPIPTANFLLIALPLSFTFYQPGFNNMISFAITYCLIMVGLMFTGGRATLVALATMKALMTAYLLLMTPNPLFGLIVVWGMATIYLLTKTGKKQLEKTVKAVKNAKTKKEKRLMLWRLALEFAFAKPFIGVGIENVGHLFRQKSDRKTNKEFKDAIVDKTHNYFLDLWLEGGLPYMAIFVAMCIFGIYSYQMSPYPFVSIAIIGFMIDVFFSFPLQINYLTIMLLLACSGGVAAFALPAWILLLFIPLFAFNYLRALRTNEASRHVQVALGFLDNNNYQGGFNLLMSALSIAPDEERFYNLSGDIMYKMLASAQQNAGMFNYYNMLFETKQKFITKNCIGADKAFSGIGLLYSGLYRAKGNKKLREMALLCAGIAKKINPHSFRYSRIKLTIYWHDKDYKAYQETVKNCIYSYVQGGGNTEVTESQLWNMYFEVAKATKKNDMQSLYKSRIAKGFIEEKKG